VRDLGTALLPIGVGAVCALVFLLGVLTPGTGKGAAFAAALLCLLLAAAGGPFCFERKQADGRWSSARRGALRCAVLGVAAATVCGIVSVRHDGPTGFALMAGLFCGLYAYALGSVGDLLRVPLLFAALGVVLLATLHFWDDLFLLQAADRKGSAALAFQINAAAAAAVTLDFDWIHAKALYTDNQTAESLVGVPLLGLGSFALKLLGIAAAATLAGAWTRR
jgi:hypothetical protein